LRLTPISNNELVGFQNIINLKHVLLESPYYMNHEVDATITDDGVSGFFHSNYDSNNPELQIIINRVEPNLRRVNER